MILENSPRETEPLIRWFPPASDPGRDGTGLILQSSALTQPRPSPHSPPLPASKSEVRTSTIGGSHEIPENQERLPLSGMTLLYCPHCGKPAAPVPDGLAPALWAAIQIQVARLGTSLECRHCNRRSLIRQSPVRDDDQPKSDGETDREEEC